MNLIKFTLFSAIISLSLGELGKYPFGASSISFSLTDLLLTLTIALGVIWVSYNQIKVIIPKVFYWLMAFWLMGLISLLFSLSLVPGLDVLKNSLYLIRFIVYSLVFLVVYNLTYYKTLSVFSLCGMWIRVGIITVLLGLIQLVVFPTFDWYGLPLIAFGFDPHQSRLSALFLDPNFSGVFLALIAGIAFYSMALDNNSLSFKKFLVQKEWLAFFGLLLLAIFLTYSRTAYLMVAIFLLGLILVFRQKIKFKLLLMLILFFSTVFLSLVIISPRFADRIRGSIWLDQSASERFFSWGKGVKIVTLNPLTGVGFNNLRTVQEKLNLFRPDSFDGGHSGAGFDSSLLVVLSTTGIFGLLIYLGFWIQLVNSFIKQDRYGAKVITVLILALIIASQFLNALFFPPIMLGYFSILGAVHTWGVKST